MSKPSSLTSRLYYITQDKRFRPDVIYDEAMLKEAVKYGLRELTESEADAYDPIVVARRGHDMAGLKIIYNPPLNYGIHPSGYDKF